MGKCQNCGGEIRNGHFCPYCGASAPVQEQPQNIVINNYANSNNDPTNIEKDKVYCPRCHSNNIHFVTETRGKNYQFGNGCCGAILLGPFGLLCGLCGTGTRTRNVRKCLNCNKEF